MEQVSQNEASGTVVMKTVGLNRVQSDLLVSIAQPGSIISL